MKKEFYLSSSLLITIFFISACKKTNSIPTTQEQRLVTVISKSPTDSVRYDFLYDDQGRLTKVNSKTNADPTITFYNISYSGNEIMIAQAVDNLPENQGADTIYIFTDESGRAAKMVRRGFLEYFSPNSSQRVWHMDTTTYTYNADGFLSSGLISNYDTVWYTTNGIPQTSVVRMRGTITHTITAGNLARSFEVDQIHQVDGSPTTTVIRDWSNEITHTFDYTQSYSNKTDFSNGAIATATTWISEAPVNKNYKNLPDKISEEYISKDQNGTIIGNYPSEISYQFTFNAEGLLSTKMDTHAPGRVLTYIYGNRP